jgi:hypothetical protein
LLLDGGAISSRTKRNSHDEMDTFLPHLALRRCGRAAPVPVTVDNLVRALTDTTFAMSSFGKITHNRVLFPIGQLLPAGRPNRDTLYSFGVFDLDAGPVTIALPDPGKRYMSLQVIDEDEYTPLVTYGAGSYTITRDQVGTRYAGALIRTLVDATLPGDLDQAHVLQDAVKVEQRNPGRFEVPTGIKPAKRRCATRYWCSAQQCRI